MPIIVLIGATATGKSRLAVDVALALQEREVGAEIVNADSMLVYKGMDIGTAKPTMAERRGVAHHLVDILEVSQNASVADFQTLARATIADILARGAVPVVVGGSALYIRAIVDHFEFPGSDLEVRARWEAELERVGAVALHDRLRELAPESAAKIEPANGRRTVRAFEVMEITGTMPRDCLNGHTHWRTFTSLDWIRTGQCWMRASTRGWRPCGATVCLRRSNTCWGRGCGTV